MPLYPSATATAPAAHAASHGAGQSDAVTVTLAQMSGAGTMAAEAAADYAPIASPTLTGTPAAPTAAADTSTTQLATTAFVLGQSGTTSPVVDGVAAAGSATRWSRADHVHPTDTSRAPTVEAVNAVAASGASQTLPDPSTTGMSRIVLTATCTFTFPTAVAGKSFYLALVQDGTGSRTVVWPDSVKWANDVAPTLSTGAADKDVFSFSCDDGATWDGFAAGLNMS